MIQFQMLSAGNQSEYSDKPLINGDFKFDIVQALLYEIIRVKDLIRCYEDIPNNGGMLGVSILTELVTEAHKSLMNYDIELMNKYYDLLTHCD